MYGFCGRELEAVAPLHCVLQHAQIPPVFADATQKPLRITSLVDDSGRVFLGTVRVFCSVGSWLCVGIVVLVVFAF